VAISTPTIPTTMTKPTETVNWASKLSIKQSNEWTKKSTNEWNNPIALNGTMNGSNQIYKWMKDRR
jgi:hypothetical protein